jgi:SOS response regulatory protein OraA/RecX
MKRLIPIIISALAFTACSSATTETSRTEAPTTTAEVAETTDAPIATTPDETTTVPTTEAPEQGTLGERNAKDKALDYLDAMSFSRQGLVDQLLYEGFSLAEAEYGVNAIDVDWNEQAALKAQDYLDSMSFSRQGLVDQLLYEGFTQAQVEYGVNAVGY